MTANTTLTIIDTVIIARGTTTKLTVTLPAAAANAGRYYVVKRQAGGNPVEIKPPGVETIDGSPSLTLTTVGEGRSMISDGANWITIGNAK